MNGYNPMLDYQRNQLLAQQAMIQQQLANISQMSQPISQATATPAAPQTQYFTREVGSLDEARRVVPNPGEVYIFLDGGAGKIYLKQMNPDTGRSDYLFYNLDRNSPQAEKDPMALISERLENIEKAIGGLRNESVPGNGEVPAVRAEPDGNADRPVHSEPVRADEGAEPAEIPAGAADVKRKRPKSAS